MSPHAASIPVEISKLRDPGAEHTITENVGSVGVRVLTKARVGTRYD